MTDYSIGNLAHTRVSVLGEGFFALPASAYEKLDRATTYGEGVATWIDATTIFGEPVRIRVENIVSFIKADRESLEKQREFLDEVRSLMKDEKPDWL